MPGGAVGVEIVTSGRAGWPLTYARYELSARIARTINAIAPTNINTEIRKLSEVVDMGYFHDTTRATHLV